MKLLGTPRYEDFDISHFGGGGGGNPWEFLGLGWTMEERAGPDKADVSPYLALGNVDPRWYAACGGDVEGLKRLAREARERGTEGKGEWIERRV